MTKIKDIVFTINDRTITKTRVIGKKDLLEKDENGKEVTKTYFLIRGEKRGYGDSGDDNWVSPEDTFDSLEKAKQIITERIQREVVEELSKITVVDVSNGGES